MARLGAPAAVIAVIWWLSDQPDPDPTGGGIPAPAAHAIAYAVLFAAWAWALRGRAALAFALTVAYGVVDELHQRSTPGRDPDPLDVLWDATGAGLIWMAIRRAGWLRPRGTNERPSGDQVGAGSAGRHADGA